MALRAIVRISVRSNTLPSDFYDINIHVKNINEGLRPNNTELFLMSLLRDVESAMSVYGQVSRVEWLGTTDGGFIELGLYWE